MSSDDRRQAADRPRTMNKRALGKTGLSISPLALGGNVFGSTVDERQSFAVLDAFADYGFDAIDTADVAVLLVAGDDSRDIDKCCPHNINASRSRAILRA